MFVYTIRQLMLFVFSHCMHAAFNLKISFSFNEHQVVYSAIVISVKNEQNKFEQKQKKHNDGKQKHE